ncbi:MAG: TIGR03936 family radical SAM-associated protein [Defluviitaleaceae bacterium]|nr:TIGR03936 family radical SAM-associated protein [Defluviitaleaceae bacterium]
MYKIRLRFSKSETLKYIGHLDFLRVLQQTIRRAGLPAAFSQGFNPHLLISFALPLPLGMESVNDYADVTLESEMPFDEIAEKINASAPRGLFIKSAYPAENKAASVVEAADYVVKFHGDCPICPQSILQSETLIIPKKTKKGVKDTDIRADIFDIRVEERNVFMKLSAGSTRFLNPLTVAQLLCESVGEISRLELYRISENGEHVTL